MIKLDEKIINNAIVSIESILLEYAPNDEAVRYLAKYKVDLQSTWKDDKAAILKSYVGSLYDGLAYGNWPWFRLIK